MSGKHLVKSEVFEAIFKTKWLTDDLVFSPYLLVLEDKTGLPLNQLVHRSHSSKQGVQLPTNHIVATFLVICVTRSEWCRTCTHPTDNMAFLKALVNEDTLLRTHCCP